MTERPPLRDRALRSAQRRIDVAWAGFRARRATARDASQTVGLVEEFSRDRVAGWVATPAGSPPARVVLQLSDLEVASTSATDPMPDRAGTGEVRRFDLPLRDVWDYARTTDRMTVRVDGTPLAIVGHGTYRSPDEDGERTIKQLRKKLAEGHIFAQGGRLRISKKLDTRWQAIVMGLYTGVREAVAAELGRDVFFVYGTLLGAVREGGVIGHDHDFDCAYVSDLTDGRAAAEQLRDLGFALIERGYDVECRRTALHIHPPGDRRARIDLFHLYFDDAGLLQFPFGVANTTDVMADDWTGTKEIDFAGGRGLVPRNAEQLVEHIYGPGWRSPNPGFDWSRDRAAQGRGGILPLDFGVEILWANFYAHHGFDTASTFADTVLRRDDIPPLVVDIGCGDGRDSAAFAATGRRVIGLDRSPKAVQVAGAKGIERAEFAVCDVSNAAVLQSALRDAVGAADGPVLFYLRFLLCAIGAPAEKRLLQMLAEHARPGDLFAAEFRTDGDAELPKAFGDHFRRFQDGHAFGARLDAEYGFELLAEDSGTGLAPYEDEDPDVYRVIARRR